MFFPIFLKLAGNFYLEERMDGYEWGGVAQKGWEVRNLLKSIYRIYQPNPLVVLLIFCQVLR